MDIGYVTRSAFLAPCEAAIQTHRAELDAGGTISVDLGDGGYDGRVVVTIDARDRTTFATDWTSTDPTRFPARIKAAATALLNCGCEGSFEVSHTDGTLAIRPVLRPESGMSANGRTVYLVSCVSQKRQLASAARDLYISDLFCKARDYAERPGCPWYILSADHGLVRPDQVIAPYDRTLNTMASAERRVLAECVDRQLAELVPELRHIVFLAGSRYREFLATYLKERGVSTSVPMEGLRIGEQLAWLKRKLTATAE